MSIFYSVIYNKYVNGCLLWLNKNALKVWPKAPKLPPSGVLAIKVQGKTLKLCTNQTSYVTQFVFWNGYRNFEYTKIFEHLVGKVDVFFDVGANIGYYSILGCLINPKLKVYGFEPSEAAFQYYKNNVEINSMSERIVAERVALSDMNGLLNFKQMVNLKYGNSVKNLSGEATVLEYNKGVYESYEVISTTLDSYVVDKFLDKVDLIKIDTEGSENLILRGGIAFLLKYEPIVICETLYNVIEEDLEKLMNKCGYEFYNHVGDKLVKVETIVRSIDNGVRNCFFVPPSKKHLIIEFL